MYYKILGSIVVKVCFYIQPDGFIYISSVHVSICTATAFWNIQFNLERTIGGVCIPSEGSVRLQKKIPEF